MRVSGYLSGAAAMIKRYQIGATTTNAGIPLLGASEAGTGLVIGTTTGLVGMVGVATDKATYSTTQLGNANGGGGGMGASLTGGAASASAMVGVIINPDLLITNRLSGGATEGTALTVYTNTSASAGGTVATAAVGTNTFVDGTIWFVSGANTGQYRTITAWSSNTSLTVTVPFDYAIAVGDQFCACPYAAFQSLTTGAAKMTFTTNMLETRADTASTSGAAGCVVVDLFLRDLANNGTTDSYVVFSPSMNHQLYTSIGS